MFSLCKVNGQVGFMVENKAKRAWSKLSATFFGKKKLTKIKIRFLESSRGRGKYHTNIIHTE